jgi:signal transduction histidine kinase
MLIQSIYRRLMRTYLLAWAVLLLGLVVTGWVGWYSYQHARELDAARFHRLVSQASDALRDRLDRYQLALLNLADFAASRPAISPAEWGFRVRLLWPEKNYPGLLEFGFAETSWYRNLQKPHDTEALAAASLVTESNSLIPVFSWVAPPSAFDGVNPNFFSDSQNVEAARQAMRTGVPAYSYRRELSTEIAGTPARGFTIFAPIFDAALAQALTRLAPGAEEEAQALRVTHARGVVFGSLEPNLLLENLFGTARREVEFDLFSGFPLSEETWLNARGTSPPSLSPEFKAYLRTNALVQIHGQPWVLAFHTTPLFEQESSRLRPYSTLATGLLLSLLVAALLFSQIHARLQQEAIAAELRSACDDLQRVQNERERIGRDIHDGAIQSLYGLQLSLGHYDRLRTRDPEKAGRILERSRGAIDALIAELRQFIVQQAPVEGESLTPSNPIETLQHLVQRFRAASNIPIELSCEVDDWAHFDPSQQLHLRQIAQEALSNSLRHARPRHILIRLAARNRHLQLTVADDGSGFDASQSHAAGRGLANMHARAAQLGGTLAVESTPGRGSRVILEIPLQPQPTESHVKNPQNPPPDRG